MWSGDTVSLGCDLEQSTSFLSSFLFCFPVPIMCTSFLGPYAKRVLCGTQLTMNRNMRQNKCLLFKLWALCLSDRNVTKTDFGAKSGVVTVPIAHHVV